MLLFYILKIVSLYLWSYFSAGYLPWECEAVMVGDPWQFSLFEMSPVVWFIISPLHLVTGLEREDCKKQDYIFTQRIINTNQNTSLTLWQGAPGWIYSKLCEEIQEKVVLRENILRCPAKQMSHTFIQVIYLWLLITSIALE